MAQPNPFEEPTKSEETRARQVLEFPRRELPRTINVWRITIYTVIVVAVLAGITWWILHPR